MTTLKITTNEEEAKEQLRAFVPGVKAEDYHVNPCGFNILTIGLFTIAKYLNENSGTEVFNYESIFRELALNKSTNPADLMVKYEYDGKNPGLIGTPDELCSEIDAILQDQWKRFINYINIYMKKCNSSINVINSLASTEFNQYLKSILNLIIQPSIDNYDLSTIGLCLFNGLCLGGADERFEEVGGYPMDFEGSKELLEVMPEFTKVGPYWYNKVSEFFNNIINYIIGNQCKVQNVLVSDNNTQQPNTNINANQQATANSTTQAQPQQQGPINLASWINYEPTNGKSNLESINVTSNSDLGNVPDTYEECSPEQKGRKMSVKDSLEKFAKQQSLDVDDFMGQYENFVGNKINLDSLPTEETIKANEKNMLRGMLDSLEKFMLA